MTDLLDLEDALKIIESVVPGIVDQEKISSDKALGRTLAQDIIAPYALPPFTSSTVDGYAFSHADGHELLIAGASYAGTPYKEPVKKGEAIRIATGSIIPQDVNTVAMQEYCTVKGGNVTIDPMPQKGANIRLAGADISKNSVAVPKGTTLRPQDIALLCALGVVDVMVFRRIKIAVASTGHELLSSGSSLKEGQIIDTNSIMLRQMLSNTGCAVTILPPIPDDLDATQKTLFDISGQFDLVITTGGVSVGDKDYIREAIKSIGTTHFWRLAIRPGKPVLFGQIGTCLLLGLPGNPVSAFVTGLLIGKSVVSACLGGKTALPPYFNVELVEDIQKDTPLRYFLRARLEHRNGTYVAIPCEEQSSNLFTSLTKSDGLIDIAREGGNITAGSFVRYRPYKIWVS